MRPLLDCCCGRHVARKHILRLRLRLATAQSRSETLRREVEISAERLGVAEHTFQEHSERHPADQVAFRIVFSMQAKFGRWFCNTAFFFCNAVQNSSQPICRHDPAARPEGAHLVAHAVQVICFGPGAPRVAMSGFLWRVAGDLATRENEAGSDASGPPLETLSVSHPKFEGVPPSNAVWLFQQASEMTVKGTMLRTCGITIEELKGENAHDLAALVSSLRAAPATTHLEKKALEVPVSNGDLAWLSKAYLRARYVNAADGALPATLYSPEDAQRAHDIAEALFRWTSEVEDLDEWDLFILETFTSEVRTRTGFATLCCVGPAPLRRR